MIETFLDCRFDTATGRLERRGAPCALRPRAAALLADLIAHRARFVTPAELLARVWVDARVTRSSVTTEMCVLRRSIGDDGRAPRVIRSDRRRGYRFAPDAPGRAPADGTACASHVGDIAGLAAAPTGPSTGRVMEYAMERSMEHSMETAERSLARTRTHGPRHLEVVGAGAHAFAREWADAAEGRGWLVHTGRCADGACPALWPWWQLARGFCERADGGAERARFARLCDEIAAIAFTSSEAPATFTRQRHFALVDSICRGLLGAARDHPTAIVLGWPAEPEAETARLLSFLLDGRPAAPLWIVTAVEHPRITPPLPGAAVDRVHMGSAGVPRP